MAWLDAFFAAGRSLAPHGYCLLWDPTLVWTHVVADSLIAAAYFSIPLALISFIRRRRDLQFGWIFWLFALFIVACGSTHLMSIWTLWRPDYGVEAMIKVVTAIASVGTAIVLWPLIPRLLLIPSPNELRTQNAHLEQTLARLTQEIAERKRVEDALRQAHKMEAIGQLTGGIAHDFNNLLQSVTGSLALIARHPQSDKVAKWAALGLQAAERGGRLTAQLLAFSRTQKLELRPVAIGPLLAGMDELMQSAIGKAISVDRVSAAAPDTVVLGDPTQIELAVLNLAINARDAMPDGGQLSIRAEPVTLTADPELAAGDYVRISVTDTGTGMPPDVAARAFDPFFTTKPVGKGTGLGLSMVYGVARQSGGRAEIDTVPGRGTTVSMLLKAIPAEAEAAVPTVTDPSAGRRLRVLVVDDDEDVRLMTASMLEDLGHRPIAVGSGEAALALLSSGPPDLIVLDFLMPGMNGAALAAAIRERGITAPILFATGFADTAQLDDVLGADATMLRKPYDLGSLAAAIARACAAASD